MILPDHEIKTAVGKGVIGIEPFMPDQVQPASYDMRLGTFFRTYEGTYDSRKSPVDPKSPLRRTSMTQCPEDGFIELPARRFCLASTIERVTLPAEIVARVEGKSSLARMGLFVHVTAGFIDPGFSGHITLELFNGNHLGVILYPGMLICQLSFERMHSAAERPYGHGAIGSKYGGDEPGPVESMYHRNYEEES